MSLPSNYFLHRMVSGDTAWTKFFLPPAHLPTLPETMVENNTRLILKGYVVKRLLNARYENHGGLWSDYSNEDTPDSQTLFSKP